MKQHSVIFILFIVFATLAARGQDTTDAANGRFTVSLRTGSPQKIINNQVEISLEMNMFGRAELAFKGIVGIQLEPTSAYRHHSINNIARGDNLYMKLNDSTVYLLHIANLWSNAMEIDFSQLPKSFASPVNTGGDASGNITMRPVDNALKGRFIFYALGNFPLGEFAGIDLSKPGSGFAEFGIGGGVGYSHQLTEHAEIGGVLLYTHNSLNESMIYYEILGDYPTATINIKAWDLLWVLGEGGFTGNILPTLNYYIRGSAGLVSGYAPDVTSVAVNVARSYLVGSCTTFAYGAAFGFRESEKIDLGVRFLNANGTFKKVDQASTQNLMNLQIVLGFIL
jgi:hypothetical protein